MNTIKYSDLKQWFIQNEQAKKLAKDIFGDKQPRVFQTGFYSALSWNWGYIIGIAKDDAGEIYEVVTQFGAVKAARMINL